MNSRLVQPSHQLPLLYWQNRFSQVLGHFPRALLSSLYSRQLQYITVKRLDGPEAVVAPHPTAQESEAECLMVDSLEALQAVAQEIPTSFRDSVDDLKRRLAQ